VGGFSEGGAAGGEIGLALRRDRAVEREILQDDNPSFRMTRGRYPVASG
jgi:hypothetical protein